MATIPVSRETLLAVLSALHGALNLEGAALSSMYCTPTYKGLDVPYHYRKIRAALHALESEGVDIFSE